MQLPVRKKWPFFAIASVILFTFWSCGELFDSSDYELEKLKATPEMSIPLAFGELGISDLINEEDQEYVKVYPDGLVYLFYEKTLVTKDIRDMLKFPDKSFSESLPVPPGTLLPRASETTYASVELDRDLGFAPEKLTEIKFKPGTILILGLNFTPQNPASGVFELELELPDFQKNGAALKQRITALSGGSAIIDLGDYVATLDDNRFTARLSLIEKPHGNTVVITHPTEASVILGFESIDFQYVKGFFGERTPTRIPTLTIDINAFGNALGDAEVSFAEPKINLEITSEYGLPATLEFEPFEVRKENAEPLPILFSTPNPVVINAPATLGGQAVSNVGFANVAAVFDYAPQQFYYQFQMGINKGLTSGSNFCADTSKISVKLTVEVPVHGKATGIVLTDTFDIDLSDSKQSEIESAVLHSIAVNELPLEAALQIYLADENGVLIDSIFATGQTALIKGSTVTSAGDLSAPGIADVDIPLSAAKLEALFEARKMIVRMATTTSKDGSGNYPLVKFKSNYKINIKLGLEAKLNLEVDL